MSLKSIARLCVFLGLLLILVEGRKHTQFLLQRGKLHKGQPFPRGSVSFLVHPPQLSQMDIRQPLYAEGQNEMLDRMMTQPLPFRAAYTGQWASAPTTMPATEDYTSRFYNPNFPHADSYPTLTSTSTSTNRNVRQRTS